jgi:hypothetical protein
MDSKETSLSARFHLNNKGNVEHQTLRVLNIGRALSRIPRLSRCRLPFVHGRTKRRFDRVKPEQIDDDPAPQPLSKDHFTLASLFRKDAFQVKNSIIKCMRYKEEKHSLPKRS